MMTITPTIVITNHTLPSLLIGSTHPVAVANKGPICWDSQQPKNAMSSWWWQLHPGWVVHPLIDFPQLPWPSSRLRWRRCNGPMEVSFPWWESCVQRHWDFPKASGGLVYCTNMYQYLFFFDIVTIAGRKPHDLGAFYSHILFHVLRFLLNLSCIRIFWLDVCAFKPERLFSWIWMM